MGRTFIRPDQQIESSLNYLSQGTAGATLQSNAVSIEDDLNAIRIQVARLLDATMAGNWYDDVGITTSGKKRSVKQLNTGLDTLETKALLARVSQGTSVAVPASQNYVMLSATNSTTPGMSIAVALTTLGAVAAQSTLSGTAFAASELSVIAGALSNSPRNLCVVRDGTTGQVVESGGLDVFALLQVESTATDGAAFNDTASGNRGKLSFVTINQSTGAVQAAAAADIGGHTIQYAYAFRSTLGLMPEQGFLGNAQYVDSIGDQNVNLQRASNNSGATPVALATSLTWQIPNSSSYQFQNAAGATTLFSITPSATGNAAAFNTDTFAVTTSSPANFNKGVQVASGGQTINIGTTTGQISTAGALSLVTTGGNALASVSGGALTWTDGFESASTWQSGSLALSASASEWSAYKSYFGEASLMAGMVLAAQKGSHETRWATVTPLVVAAGAVVTGAGSGANLNVALPAYFGTVNMISNVKCYVNGILQQQGTSVTDTSADWYPVNNATDGSLKFTFPLRKGDVVALEIHGNAADNA